MVYRSNFTSERFGRTLYLFIRLASAVSFTKHTRGRPRWVERINGLKKLARTEMYCCKAFQILGDGVADLSDGTGDLIFLARKDDGQPVLRKVSNVGLYFLRGHESFSGGEECI
jgi:hypothetical protein